MGKTFIRRGSKNITKRDWRRFTVALERTYHLKLPIHSKIYSSDSNSTSDYMRIPPRIGLESWLTVRKPIISPILSLTLLQIYCIGLIVPISYSFWVGPQFVTLQLYFLMIICYAVTILVLNFLLKKSICLVFHNSDQLN